MNQGTNSVLKVIKGEPLESVKFWAETTEYGCLPFEEQGLSREYGDKTFLEFKLDVSWSEPFITSKHLWDSSLLSSAKITLEKTETI